MTDAQFTDHRKDSFGGLDYCGGSCHNGERSQSLNGDIFVANHGEPLVANKQFGWDSGINYNRLATTLTNNDYGHTLAGLGGHHENGIGSWETYYEAAPIVAYCGRFDGYGGSNNYFGPHPAWTRCGMRGSWLDVRFAVFVRSKAD